MTVIMSSDATAQQQVLDQDFKDDVSPQKIQDHVDWWSDTDWWSPVWDSQVKIQNLQTELDKMIDIAKMAQSNYLRTKMEFDSYQARMSAQADESKLQTVFAMIRKLAPVIDQLQLSISHAPNDNISVEFVKWISLVYDNMIKFLECYYITLMIPSVGDDMDTELHEPMGTLPVENSWLVDKIVQVLANWYIYQKEDIKMVIVPAKILLWVWS